jgi:hypothetical protein
MSGAFVYTPNSSHNELPGSPFIPSPTYFPHSPLPSPQPSPRQVRFNVLDSDSEEEKEPEEEWPKQRRPSWHGTRPPFLTVPTSPATAPSFLAPPPEPTAQHKRRHSFGAAPQPVIPVLAPLPAHSHWPPFAPAPAFSHGTVLCPLLDANRPTEDFYLSLCSPVFRPLRIIPTTSFTSSQVRLSSEDLAKPATHPPVTTFEIFHPDIPQWPILVRFPIVTVEAALKAVHYALHTPLTHPEWEKVPSDKAKSVARAYRRRCKALAEQEGWDARRESDKEAAKGVKRIDFLKLWQEKGRRDIRFRGFMKERVGAEKWKLVVA